MLAASRRLDDFLAGAAKEGGAMPEVGGRKLAGAFTELLADVRKQIEELHVETAAAITEMVEEVRIAKDVPKMIRAETAEIRKAFEPLLGNKPPETPGT